MKTTRAYNLTVLLLMSAIVAGLAAMGCAHQPAALISAPAKVATAQASVKSEHAAVTTEHAAARQDIAAVTKAPTFPPSLLPPLKSADTHVAQAEEHNQAADKALSDAIAANTETAKQAADLAAERDTLAAKVKAYDNGWLGGKGLRLYHTLIAIGILLVLVLVTYAIIAATHPGVGGAAKLLLGIGTGGFHWVVEGVKAVVLHFHHGAAPKPAAV
jgi:hypothetical protein